MGFLSQTCILMLLFACSFAKNDEAKEKCEELTSFATGAVEELSTMEGFPRYKLYFQRTFSINITDEKLREEVLCKMAGATNLRELYEALPSGLISYEGFVQLYKEVVTDVAERVGGYTNMFRIQKMHMDIVEWSQQLKNGNTLPEVTDLPTLTHFLQVMQVKFGSRWMALVLHIQHLDFLIEDPVEFAQKLFVDGNNEALEHYTGLDSNQAHMLIEILTGGYEFRFKSNDFDHLYAEGVELVGDLGFFNLKEE